MQGSYGRARLLLGGTRPWRPKLIVGRPGAGSLVRHSAHFGFRTLHTQPGPAALTHPPSASQQPTSRTSGPTPRLAPPVWRKVAERDCRDGQFDHSWFYPHHVSVGVPVILRGAANEWPAVRKWSLDYLADHGADTHVVVSLSNEEVEASVKDQSMTLAQYIRMVLSPATSHHQEPTPQHGQRQSGQQLHQHGQAKQYEQRPPAPTPPPGRQMPYLKQMNLLAQFPALGRDLRCASLMSPTTLWSKTFCWMGPTGAVTGTHNDDENNVSVQILGRKRFLLVPPHQRGLLYPNAKYDPGTGCCCDVSMDQPDLERHPLFAQATVHEAVLEPGDVLFVPLHWYHHVRCLTPSVSVNYFASRPLEMLTQGPRRGMRQVLHRLGLLGNGNCVCCATPSRPATTPSPSPSPLSTPSVV